MPLTLMTVTQPVPRGAGIGSKATARKAVFEGNYTQRSPADVNPIKMEVSLTWAQTTPQIKEITDFLIARKGTEAFYFTLPNEPTPRLWTCEQWTDNPGRSGNSSLSAIFDQVFDIT